MLWIIQAITEAILEVVGGLFSLVTNLFLSDIQLDIGARIHNGGTITTALTTMFQFGTNMFDKTISKVSAFDQVFGYALSKYTTLIITLALLFSTLIWLFKIFRTITNPEESENPIELTGRFALTFLLTYNAYSIFIIFETIFNNIYIKFSAIAMNYQLFGVAGGNQASLGEVLVNVGTNLLTGLFPAAGVGVTIAVGIINIVLIITIIVNFFKLLLEVVERYVLLGVIFYTAPLGFCTLVDKNSKIFSNWVHMIASHFVCMISGCFFLGTACIAVRAYPSASAIVGSYASYLLFLFMLIAWLMVGQAFDAYLKGLGLSTAQTGKNLGAEVWGLLGAGRAASQAVKHGAGAYNTITGKSADLGKSSVGSKAASAAMAQGPAQSGKKQEAGVSPISSKQEAAKTMSQVGVAPGRASLATGAARGFKDVSSSTVTGPNGDKSMLISDGGRSMAVIGPAAMSQNSWGYSRSGVPVAIVGDKSAPAAMAANRISQPKDHIRDASNGTVGVTDTNTGSKYDLDLGQAQNKVIGADGSELSVPTYAPATLTDENGNVESGFVFNGTTAGDGSQYDLGVDAYDSNALGMVSDSAREIQFGEGDEAMQGIFVPNDAFESAGIQAGDIPSEAYAGAMVDEASMNFNDADMTTSGGYYAGSDVNEGMSNVESYVAGGSSMDQVFDTESGFTSESVSDMGSGDTAVGMGETYVEPTSFGGESVTAAATDISAPDIATPDLGTPDVSTPDISGAGNSDSIASFDNSGTYEGGFDQDMAVNLGGTSEAAFGDTNREISDIGRSDLTEGSFGGESGFTERNYGMGESATGFNEHNYETGSPQSVDSYGGVGFSEGSYSDSALQDMGAAGAFDSRNIEGQSIEGAKTGSQVGNYDASSFGENIGSSQSAPGYEGASNVQFESGGQSETNNYNAGGQSSYSESGRGGESSRSEASYHEGSLGGSDRMPDDFSPRDRVFGSETGAIEREYYRETTSTRLGGSEDNYSNLMNNELENAGVSNVEKTNMSANSKTEGRRRKKEKNVFDIDPTVIEEQKPKK